MRRQPTFAHGVGARAICPVCNADGEYTSLRKSPAGVWQCPRHIDTPRPEEWPNHNHPDDVEPEPIALHHPRIGNQPVDIPDLYVDRVNASPFVPPAVNLTRKPTY